MRVGIIGRFQPLHNGHERLLERYADHDLVVAIGSANVRDERNPLSYAERYELVHLIVPEADVLPLDDFDDDDAWIDEATQVLGELELLVTGNDHVRELLEPYYEIITPEEALGTIPDVSATKVREAISSGDEWKRFVPYQVAHYLEAEGLIGRFR